MKKEQFVIVSGWQHSDSGDDKFFERGFVVPANRTVKQFSDWFKAKKLRGPVRDDFVVRKVSPKVWSRKFQMKRASGPHGN
jgi:hypothetical protein